MKVSTRAGVEVSVFSLESKVHMLAVDGVCVGRWAREDKEIRCIVTLHT